MTDTINILNTAYKNFDRYLSKYIGQKINCLVIGANNGDYSSWLLNNICTNIYSKVFSIDKWTDHILESVFDSNIDTTNKLNYHIKINKSIRKGLINLQKIKYVIFDVIIINTKTDDSNLISNTIIAWNLLNYNGIIIFDNYRDSYVEEEFKPKKSIDSFISMYRDQITKLDSEFQYIIEKKSNIKLKDIEEQKIIDIIDNYKFESFYMKFEENIDDDIEFRLANIELDENMNKINNKIIYIFIYLNTVLNTKLNINIQTDIRQNIKKYITEYNIVIDYNNFDLLYRYYNFYNHLKKKYINYKHIFINSSRFNKDTFNLLFSKFKFQSKFQISFNNLIINEKTYINNLSNINKYDLILFDGVNYEQNINITYSNYYLYYYLYQISFAINIQEKNGTLYLNIPIIFNINLINDIICLLNKYYSKITIINRTSQFTGIYLIFKCTNFKEITQKELTQLNTFILKLFKNNTIIFNSLLKINYNNYNTIKIFNNKIILYIDKLLNIINNFNKIISYKTNTNIYNLFIYKLIYIYLLQII